MEWQNTQSMESRDCESKSFSALQPGMQFQFDAIWITKTAKSNSNTRSVQGDEVGGSNTAGLRTKVLTQGLGIRLERRHTSFF